MAYLSGSATGGDFFFVSFTFCLAVTRLVKRRRKGFLRPESRGHAPFLPAAPFCAIASAWSRELGGSRVFVLERGG